MIVIISDNQCNDTTRQLSIPEVSKDVSASFPFDVDLSFLARPTDRLIERREEIESFHMSGSLLVSPFAFVRSFIGVFGQISSSPITAVCSRTQNSEKTQSLQPPKPMEGKEEGYPIFERCASSAIRSCLSPFSRPKPRDLFSGP